MHKGVKNMWNIPSRERLSRIPRLYETEHIPAKDKDIHLHFFIGGCDWYVSEYDGQDTFFGFCILNSDYQNAEWGYVSFSELKSIKIDGCFEIDCVREEYFNVQKASQIEKICLAQGWSLQSSPAFREY